MFASVILRMVWEQILSVTSPPASLSFPCRFLLRASHSASFVLRVLVLDDLGTADLSSPGYSSINARLGVYFDAG